MSRRGGNEIRAGIFILLGIVFIVLTIFTLGRERQLFEKQEPYHAYFENVKGLQNGAPVRLGGITIGRVDRITFSENLADNRVHVTILINEGYLERIRDDSRASIQTQGLLGDRMMSISTGQSLTQLPPGATLQSEEPGDLSDVLVSAGKVAADVTEISQTVKDVLKDFQKDSLADLTTVLESLATITNEIRSGDGLLHRIIFSKEDGRDLLVNLEESSASLKEILYKVKKGSGLLHTLIYDPRGKRTVRSLGEASEHISTAAAELATLASDIRSGNGLLNALIYDESPEGVDEIFTRLSKTAQNLEAVSTSLAEGSGTLGALLMDSSVYDNIVEVTDDAKRSFLLKAAVRSSLRSERRPASGDSTVAGDGSGDSSR